jgi:hypothetical protein
MAGCNMRIFVWVDSFTFPVSESSLRAMPTFGRVGCIAAVRGNGKPPGLETRDTRENLGQSQNKFAIYDEE